MIFAADEVTLQKTDAGYSVLIAGKTFAGYITDFAGTPIVYPVVGPTGKKLTRDYPMQDLPDKSEEKDHPHHRSLWFTHGAVNGLDFWTADRQTKQSRYKIVHRKFSKAEIVNNTAVIETENDWLGKNGETICSDIRTLRFGTIGANRFIDFDITLKAEHDKVVFGDTKEGTFAVRVAETMRLTAKENTKENENKNENENKSGWRNQIVNAEGLTDDQTWGKRSAWVDYSGVVENETLGIAILNHPSSFRFPTYWHVRDYGLFAANPFGTHDFEKKKNDKHLGDLTLKKGETFSLRYRLILHKGSAKDAGLDLLYKEYAE
ncbi:hypothetical protein FACS189454_02080 [Planctomycetales bacterium]|nr:hypothetical protein FACS189454_02080 [Planctomycetales bacterium]